MLVPKDHAKMEPLAQMGGMTILAAASRVTRGKIVPLVRRLIEYTLFKITRNS